MDSTVVTTPVPAAAVQPPKAVSKKQRGCRCPVCKKRTLIKGSSANVCSNKECQSVNLNWHHHVTKNVQGQGLYCHLCENNTVHTVTTIGNVEVRGCSRCLNWFLVPKLDTKE